MRLAQSVCAFCALVAVAATDGVVFPDRRKGQRGGCGSQCPQAIPLSLAKQLSSVDTSEQFLRQFVENGAEMAVQERFYGISFKSPFAQSAPQRVPFANCKPELQTMSLRDTNDPTLIYYPMCVRLEQCGGCCAHELLQCQPTKSSQLNVTVMMTQYVGNKTLKYVGKKIVTLARHEGCACDCKSKPEHCRGRQQYKKEECRCVCPNRDEGVECSQDERKLWDPSACECKCREERECSTGYIFDSGGCKCVPTPESRRYDSVYFRDRI